MAKRPIYTPAEAPEVCNFNDKGELVTLSHVHACYLSATGQMALPCTARYIYLMGFDEHVIAKVLYKFAIHIYVSCS